MFQLNQNLQFLVQWKLSLTASVNGKRRRRQQHNDTFTSSKPSAVPPEKIMCLAHISVIHAVASKTFYDNM